MEEKMGQSDLEDLWKQTENVLMSRFQLARRLGVRHVNEPLSKMIKRGEVEEIKMFKENTNRLVSVFRLK